MTRQTSDGPLVSVVMPVFNGRAFLEESIRSLQRQDHAALEIIVVDDGSTDGSVDVLKALTRQEPRMRLLEQPHGGIAAARNTALAISRGDFVTFLDQDDLCPPGTIARQRARLEREPDLSAVVGRTLTTASEHEMADPFAVPADRVAHTVLLSSGLFRRSVFERIGPFDSSYALADDMDFLLRMMEAGEPVALEDELASVHRRHPVQATADHAATRREAALVLSASLRRRRMRGAAGPLRHPLASVIAR
jgi:glycosyltransferase involved in cell wall biosynthesis